METTSDKIHITCNKQSNRNNRILICMIGFKLGSILDRCCLQVTKPFNFDFHKVFDRVNQKERNCIAIRAEKYPILLLLLLRFANFLCLLRK